MYVGAQRCQFFSVAAADSIGPPGIMKAFLRGQSDEGGSPSLNPINGLAVREFVDRKARLEKMDEQGGEACLILPTAGGVVEPQLRETAEVLYPSLRAFNRWLEEDWGYAANRRFGTPAATPSETFRQNVWVTPFFEDDVVGPANLIAAGHVLAGSDHPHPEGLLWPEEFAAKLEGMGDEDVRLVIRDNLARLAGVPSP